jgi:putative FmdB family regulatory protein
MPIFDYVCTECGHEVKDFHKSIKADHPTTCPECKKEGLQQYYGNHKQHITYQGPDWHEASGKRGKF